MELIEVLASPLCDVQTKGRLRAGNSNQLFTLDVSHASRAYPNTSVRFLAGRGRDPRSREDVPAVDQRRGVPGWNSNSSRAQCHIAVLLSATLILTHTVLCDLMAPTSALSPLLAHARVIVQGIAKDTAKEATEDAVQQLKSIVFAITSAGRHNRNLTADEQTAVWELVCLLWVGSCCDSEPTTATLSYHNALPSSCLCTS